MNCSVAAACPDDEAGVDDAGIEVAAAGCFLVPSVEMVLDDGEGFEIG